MKNSIKLLSLVLLSSSLIFSSCEKEEEVEEPVVTINTGTVSLTKQNNVTPDVWVYYSFTTMAELSGIDSSNFATSTDWDIAFHSRHVRLNGGQSGAGMGESYDAGIVDFDGLTDANETTFVKDSTIQIYAGMGDFGPIYITSPASTVFENAFDYDENTHPPTYSASNHVYVFKTQAGKYAKIQLLDYYNETGDSGYITFKYSYQTDGTSKF